MRPEQAQRAKASRPSPGGAFRCIGSTSPSGPPSRPHRRRRTDFIDGPPVLERFSDRRIEAADGDVAVAVDEVFDVLQLHACCLVLPISPATRSSLVEETMDDESAPIGDSLYPVAAATGAADRRILRC